MICWVGEGGRAVRRKSEQSRGGEKKKKKKKQEEEEEEDKEHLDGVFHGDVAVVLRQL